MKVHTILSLFVVLFALFSCSSATTEQENDGNTNNTEITKPEAVEAEVSQETGATAVTVAQTASTIDNEKNKEEIELINGEVMMINESLSLYTKKENTGNWETLACKLTQYSNENGIVVKTEAVCGDHTWEIYNVALTKTDSKLLYGKYLEKVADSRLPSVREFYSIGSMMPSENAYTMIFDESGKEVDPAGYRKYSVLYEAAFDAFL